MNTVTFKTNNLRSFIPFMTKDERESLVIDGTPVNEFNQVITICTFKEALNKRMRMLNHWPMNPSEKSGTLPLYVAGKHILEFDNKDDVIKYVEANIKRESVVLVHKHQ